MSPLAPCPSCRRHVRVVESACPFCGATVALASSLPRGELRAHRLGRAALFTFGAAAIAASPGCAASTTPSDGGEAADTSADSGLDAGSDASHDAYFGSFGDVYGAPSDVGPPPVDTGPADEGGLAGMYGGPPRDAGSDAGIAAPYGAPPPPPEPKP